MQNDYVKRLVHAWGQAHLGAQDNTLLLRLDPVRFGKVCASRMHVIHATDELLYGLDESSAEVASIPELARHLRAEHDKGCGGCWISSRVPLADHEDGSPSCKPKIDEWFASQKELLRVAQDDSLFSGRKNRTYRVYSSRFDISETVKSEFGAGDDASAVSHFKRISDLDYNSWDNLRLVEVVSKETTRHVAYNDNMKRFLDRDD
jgi:hypothetical protein